MSILRFPCYLAVLSVLVLLLAGQASSSRSQLDGSASVVEDDLYLAGGSVRSGGVVEGDLFAAGGEVRLDGNVTGDIMAAGGEVEVSGWVGDDARLAGGELKVRGRVQDNLLAAGGNIVLDRDGWVGRDMTAAGGRVEVYGNVSRDLKVSGGEAVIGGDIGGNVTLETREVSILPGARIKGDLSYKSPRALRIPGGVVEGRTVWVPGGVEGYWESWQGDVFKDVLGFLWLAFLGGVIVFLFPGFSREVAEKIEKTPGPSLLWGFVFAFAGVIVILMLFVTLIGIPLALIVLAAYAVAVYTSRIFFSFWLGLKIFNRLDRDARSPIWPLFVGLAVFIVAVNIPFVGVAIHAIAVFLGTGALLLLFKEKQNQNQKHESELSSSSA